MADVKKKSNDKWTVVDEKGKQYHNAGEFKTEKEAVERLKEMKGHEAHKKEPQGYKHKKSDLIQHLISLADELDTSGFHKEADILDTMIRLIVK